MARTRNAVKFDAQRDLLLKAASECFVKRGFHGAGIADICAAAGGISPGRLYHYFPSKQAIVEALVAEERAEVAALFSAFVLTRRPKAALLRLIRTAVEQSIDPDYAVLAAEIAAEAGRDPEIARIVQYAERCYREYLIAALARVREQTGAWTAGEDDRRARAITLLIDGAVVRSLLEPGCRKGLAKEVVAMASRVLG